MSKVMLDRAIAKSKKAKESAVVPAKPANTTLSDEELQSYIEMLLEASKPEPLDRLQIAMIKSGELTEKLIREKYAVI